MQIPIGEESHFKGVVDLLSMKAHYFTGPNGIIVETEECPPELVALAEEKRQVLIEAVANVDETLGEKYLEGNELTEEDLRAAIRRATLAKAFIPVFMGSAFKDKAVQPLLDGVGHYLPDPTQNVNYGINLDKKPEAKIELFPDPKKPFIGLAFKLEDGKFGQVTYLRIYQGTLKKGDMIYDSTLKKKVKVPRVVKMHANEMVDVPEVGPGEICAIFGVDCTSGTTFCSPGTNISMTSMHVPKPVISLAVKPKGHDNASLTGFNKAMTRFQKEDPTFRVTYDPESQETIMSGMGELHLEIYAERIKREYNCECVVGHPQVNYRERIQNKALFDYQHKKQTGGAGQYAKVTGYIEPIEDEENPDSIENEFLNVMSGNNIPPEFIPAIEKGFRDACASGACIGAPVQRMRFVLEDGQSHSVDSSELAFKIATGNAVRGAMKDANAQVLEPIMKVVVECPGEFQSAIVGGINKRHANVEDVDNKDPTLTIINCTAPLKGMFGYSTELRSSTEGKGEYTMEYLAHQPVMRSEQVELEAEFLRKKALRDAGKS